MRNQSRDSRLAVNDFALRVTDDRCLCAGTPGAGSGAITPGKVNVLPKSAKVVIIGGGALGTSAAFHLTDAG
ncbi:MAG: hypothetical protein MK110_07650 [Fuerstiella sp.]|nr:hypothetical protein [Fuerstiella sp.]